MTTFVACSEEEPDAPQPGLHFIAGTSGIDTIEAVLTRPLIVEFRDDGAQPLANSDIVFLVSSLLTADSSAHKAGVTLTGATITPSGQDAFRAKTDANGRLSAQVKLGQAVGEVMVVVAVFGKPQLRDTARFSIRPGKPARVTLGPRDTVLYPAARWQLRQTVRDRFGFTTTGAFTPNFTSSNDLTVSTTGIVTPRVPGRDTIIARSGTFADTVMLTTLPITGVLAASLPTSDNGALGVAVMNLDGSNYKEYAKGLGPMLPFTSMRQRFTYDGLSLIVRIGLQSDQRLWTVPLDGSAPRRLLTNPTPLSEDEPSPSPDGQWVYYCTRSPFLRDWLLFRSRLNGTGVEQVPRSTPASLDDLCLSSPTASANGQWVAWGAQGGRVVSRRLATGASNEFNREGIEPAGAPTGTRLAYIKGNPGPLYTSEFDGSDDRRVASGFYAGPISWSADGKYLLAYRHISSNESFYELVEVATGKGYRLGLKLGANAVLKPK